MRFVLAVLALLIVARPAFAADDAFCSNYAYQAQQTAFQAQDEGGDVVLGAVFGVSYFGGIDPSGPVPANCGFSGPRWSTSYDDHYNWCRSQGEAAVNAEAAARASEFRYCGVCISYVNIASLVEKDGREAFCLLHGNRWPTDPNALLQFCLAQGHSDINATIAWLQQVLNSGKNQIVACQQRKLSRRVSGPPRVVTTPPDLEQRKR